MDTERELIPVSRRNTPIARNGNGQGARDSKALVYLEALDDAHPNQESGTAVIDTLHLLRARAIPLIFLAVLGSVAGAGLTLLQTPVFQAKATIEIHPPAENVMGMQGGAGNYQPENFLQTEVKALESRTLRRKVIEALQRKGKLSTYTPPDRLVMWRSVLGLAKPVKAERARAQVVPPFDLRIHAWENTQVVDVVCDSPDPNFSADYLNTMAEEFIQLNLDARWQGYQNTNNWLTRQLEDTKARLESSESQLQQYSAMSGLLFTDDKSSVQSDKLRQIQSELSRAQADRVSRQAVYEIASASSADSVPQVIDNERLSGYQIKITELRREAAELKALYTPEHYKVVRVTAEIAEVDAAFRRERDAILQRVRNEYQAAQRRESLLLSAYTSQANTVSDQAAKAIHYDVLKRDVDTNRQLYGALLQKVKEASVASALSTNNVHVMDAAEPPSSPYKPSIVSNVMKGFGAGLFGGIFLIVALDRVNRSLRAPGETPFHLKVPELGVIPSGDAPSLGRLAGPPRTKLSNIGLTEVDTPPEERVELVTWQDSHSLVAESFRNTIASILLSSNGSRPKVILVTSASRAEGKSTAVSNLGLGLAEINQKILLIDADMRKPRLHNLFELSNSWGLSDLLRERSVLRDSPLEALARPTRVANLWVLPSGPGTLSISNLLYSERVAQLLGRFREHFDTILIDTPPMLTMSDARILGRLADGAILVVRSGKTTRDAARMAKDRLTEDGVPLIGTILNDWDRKSKARYGYAGYYYAPPS